MTEPNIFQVGEEYLTAIEPTKIHRGDVVRCSFNSYWDYRLLTHKGRKIANGYWMKGKDEGPVGGSHHSFTLKLDSPELKFQRVDPNVVPDLIKFYDTGGLLAEEYKKSQMPMPHGNMIVEALKKINPF